MIIAIIPARLASSRFFAKLLHPILNKPLIEHTFENTLACPILDEVYVATDDQKIAKVIEAKNGNVIMTSLKPQNGTERILEALQNNPSLQNSSIIVNVQGDHPKVAHKTIEEVVKMLQNDKEAQIATAVTKISYEEALSPNMVKCVFDHNQNALFFSRSLIPHHKKEFYYHIGVYAYRTKFLLDSYPKLKYSYLQIAEDLEQLKFLENGYKIKVAVVNDRPLGVDVFEDVAKVEKALCP